MQAKYFPSGLNENDSLSALGNRPLNIYISFDDGEQKHIIKKRNKFPLSQDLACNDPIDGQSENTQLKDMKTAIKDLQLQTSHQMQRLEELQEDLDGEKKNLRKLQEDFDSGKRVLRRLHVGLDRDPRKLQRDFDSKKRNLQSDIEELRKSIAPLHLQYLLGCCLQRMLNDIPHIRAIWGNLRSHYSNERLAGIISNELPRSSSRLSYDAIFFLFNYSDVYLAAAYTASKQQVTDALCDAYNSLDPVEWQCLFELYKYAYRIST